MRKFKLVPHDEVNDIWLLKEHIFWFFYSFVSAGSKEKLKLWVEKNNGKLI